MDEIKYQQVLESNRLYHDAHAKDYDKITMQGHSKRVEKVFNKYKGGRFLDMGCGTGQHLKIAKNYFDEVYGIDCSKEMVKLARKISKKVIIGDVSKVPLSSESVDFINCFSVLHHLYDQQPLIKEAARLLKPGGIFYSDNDPNMEFYRLFKWWLIFRRKFIRKKTKYLTPELLDLEQKAEYHQSTGLRPLEMARVLREAGFSKVEIEYIHPEQPDTFTKILIVLNKLFRIDSFHYYFSIIATK